jgi:hypothetical protein
MHVVRRGVTLLSGNREEFFYFEIMSAKCRVNKEYQLY